MGGTFDPIHLAHLVTAQAALEQFGLDRVVFVPAGRPPHKLDHAISPAEDRYNMVVLATQTNPSFEVSRVEIDREGPSFTVDTVEELRGRVPDDTTLYFITGTDAILGLDTWREPGRLVTLCQFVAAPRPGYPGRGAKDGLGRLEATYGCRFLDVDVPALDISSSDLRRRVSEGRTIKYLVPEPVEDYILSHGLYRPEPGV